jgi:hypothetical protein
VQQVQNNQYDDDNDQRMDPTAGLWEPWTDSVAEKAQQPQDYQYNDDYPQHEVFPFE